MKFTVPKPSKSAIALTVVSFAFGGASSFVMAGVKLPFIGSLPLLGDHQESAGGEHDEENEHQKDEDHAEKPVSTKKSSHAKVAEVTNAEAGEDDHKVRKPDTAKEHGEATKPAKAAEHPERNSQEDATGKMLPTSTHEAEKTDKPHDKEAAHWGYEGEVSPEHWAGLSPENKACGQGIEQTPIDLSSGIKGDVSPAVFSYKADLLRITNNGHTIQVGSAPGSSMTINGKRYELVQFHFHHPSEHLLNGQSFPMEAHLVHKSAAGELSVVGVFFKIGNANPQIDMIFSQMPQDEGPEEIKNGFSEPVALLPKNRSFYRYMGSLTTPPCTEGLIWTVFKEPLEISEEQLHKFATLFPHNARPVQKRNRRFLLEARAGK